MEKRPDIYSQPFPNRHLKWDHKLNLIGEKVVDPMIHCCEKCGMPILSYGRMIPCKHVFCFDCAKATDKSCLRCGDSVQRIEQSPLGGIFLCTYGGSKHSSGGCRRTYLSQRDLQAHINHRHNRHQSSTQSTNQTPSIDQTTRRERPIGEDPRTAAHYSAQQEYTASATQPHLHERMRYDSAESVDIPDSPNSHAEYGIERVQVRKSNLITVPLQEEKAPYNHEQDALPPPPQQSHPQPHPIPPPVVTYHGPQPIPQHPVPPPPPPQSPIYPVQGVPPPMIHQPPPPMVLQPPPPMVLQPPPPMSYSMAIRPVMTVSPSVHQAPIPSQPAPFTSVHIPTIPPPVSLPTPGPIPMYNTASQPPYTPPTPDQIPSFPSPVPPATSVQNWAPGVSMPPRSMCPMPPIIPGMSPQPVAPGVRPDLGLPPPRGPPPDAVRFRPPYYQH